VERIETAPERIEPDRLRVPPPPRLFRAIVEAISDFYYNSWRLVPANLAWGVGVIALMFVAGRWSAGFLLLAPLMALPTAGIFRLAALIVRGDAVALGDAVAAWRIYAAPALAAGVVLTILMAVLVLNITIGIVSGNIFGAVLAALAVWGLLVVWSVALCFSPLLVDPRRADMPIRGRLRLAGVLVLASPVRVGLLLILAGAFVAISAVLFAPLLTVSVAFVSLVATRYVLPAADRLEGRATEPVLE
jgi:hypothetical protein